MGTKREKALTKTLLITFSSDFLPLINVRFGEDWIEEEE
jgi:hypothetical protein